MGEWKNCCIPEPRGIWQKDLPPMPHAVGRVWEGSGASKRRIENESGWKATSHISGELSGKDYIGRSCDIISSDAFDTFISGNYGENGQDSGARILFRYEGDEMGTLYKDDGSGGEFFDTWGIDDDYDSRTDTMVDYVNPLGDTKKIWDAVYGSDETLLSDRDRFRNECIESDCMWVSPPPGGSDGILQDRAQCIDKVTLNGIITFQSLGTPDITIDSQLIPPSLPADSNWIWTQLDTKPGKLDRSWYVDIEPGIKKMIKDYFKSKDVKINDNDIIIENNIVNSDNSNTFIPAGDTTANHYYTRNNGVGHPIRYKLIIPCKRHLSTDECIEEYKRVQRLFTYQCERGAGLGLSMEIKRKKNLGFF